MNVWSECLGQVLDFSGFRNVPATILLSPVTAEAVKAIIKRAIIERVIAPLPRSAD